MVSRRLLLGFGVWFVLELTPMEPFLLPGSPAGAAASLCFWGKAQLQKLQLPSALCDGDGQTPVTPRCLLLLLGWPEADGGAPSSFCRALPIPWGLRGLPAARTAGEEARKHGGSLEAAVGLVMQQVFGEIDSNSRRSILPISPWLKPGHFGTAAAVLPRPQPRVPVGLCP